VLGAAFLATVGLVGVLIVLLLGHDQPDHDLQAERPRSSASHNPRRRKTQ
jgi:hypothetical protein